jgi:hypothetical protein
VSTEWTPNNTTTTNQEETMTTRTITLFDRRPVEIDEDKWPVIASTSDCDDRRHPFQANREWILKVRANGQLDVEGQAIVYGVYISKFETDVDLRGGFLVDNTTQAVTDAVWRLVERLQFDTRLGDEVIADLPAEVIA